jgi:hypothetical protein
MMGAYEKERRPLRVRYGLSRRIHMPAKFDIVRMKTRQLHRIRFPSNESDSKPSSQVPPNGHAFHCRTSCRYDGRAESRQRVKLLKGNIEIRAFQISNIIARPSSLVYDCLLISGFLPEYALIAIGLAESRHEPTRTYSGVW